MQPLNSIETLAEKPQTTYEKHTSITSDWRNAQIKLYSAPWYSNETWNSSSILLDVNFNYSIHLFSKETDYTTFNSNHFERHKDIKQSCANIDHSKSRCYQTMNKCLEESIFSVGYLNYSVLIELCIYVSSSHMTPKGQFVLLFTGKDDQ